MKRSYELTVVIRIEPSDDAMNEAVQQVKSWVETDGNGTVKSIDVWGRRRLAYEVNGQREGYYVLFNSELDADHIPELERNLKLANSVLRYLLVRAEAEKAVKPNRKTPPPPVDDDDDDDSDDDLDSDD